VKAAPGLPLPEISQGAAVQKNNAQGESNMIRKLLATTAIVTLMSTGAYAQTEPTADPMAPVEAAPNVIHADGHLASNIIGATVYNGTHDDAENIGSVNDIVIGEDGSLEAIVVGVGGFLGLGQKNVALEYDVVQWTERDGDRWLVVETTREALENLEEFDVAAYRPLPADAQVGNTQPASGDEIGAASAATDDATLADDATVADAPAATDEMATDDLAADDMAAPATEETAQDDMAEVPATDDSMAAAPADDMTDDGMAATDDMTTDTDPTETAAIDPSTLDTVDAAGISADDFIGTTVYGANDENIGSINDVILSQEGSVEAVIIDVGGFLGIGAKSVAVSMDNLSFLADGDGEFYLYTEFTQEQLEAQPEYDESTYADTRDDQLLVNPVQ
jgi:sporulation protein YlmC with PRC-barrel domain